VPGDSFWDLILKGAVHKTGDHTLKRGCVKNSV